MFQIGDRIVSSGLTEFVVGEITGDGGLLPVGFDNYTWVLPPEHAVKVTDPEFSSEAGFDEFWKERIKTMPPAVAENKQMYHFAKWGWQCAMRSQYLKKTGK